MDWAHTAQPAGRTETGDTGETADKEEMEGTGDREALRPRRSSNSDSSSNRRNIRRDGGHDRRDGDDDDNDGASTCQPP